MTNLIFFPAVSLLASGILASCTTDGARERDFPSTRVSVESRATLLSVTPPAGDSAGRFTARWLRPGCGGGGRVRLDTVTETTKYWQGDGRLYLWNEGNCLALSLTGRSTGLAGTWTLDGGARFDSIPAPYRETPCHAASDYFFGIPHDEDEDGLLTNISAAYEFDGSQALARMSLDICYARDYSAALMFEPGMSIVSEDCGEVVLKNARGDEARVATGFRENRHHLMFSHGGTTCRMTTPFEIAPGPAACGEDEGPAFWDCMMGSGFFADGG